MARRRKNKQQRSISNPAVPLTGRTILDYLGASGGSNSGVVVNARTALTISPVWQALDVITSDVSRTPFITYREAANGGKERAKDHPVYNMLRRSTGDMTSNLWLSRILGHALLYGNGYSRVIWRGNTVKRLEWLHRDWVEPKWEDGRVMYLVQYPQNRGGQTVKLPRDNVFHLCGLTMDDLGGLSLVDFARNTIGRQIAAETFGDDFFANAAMPAGFFVHPGEMSEDAQKRFLEAVVRRHGGSGNRWRPAILEEDMKYQPVSVSPVDAMLIDQLKLGVKDVARFFNVPPHKLGDDSRVSYNSLEQEEKAYFSSTLGKWLSRFEFEANDKLFVDAELDEGYFTEFLQDSWLKADTAARFNAYSVAINWGIMSRNEVRLRENLNPYEGGDEYLTPLTHQPPEEDLQPMVAEPEEPEDDEDEPETPPEDVSRSQMLIRDQIQVPIWNAVRHLWNVMSRAGLKAPNFIQFLNQLRLTQEMAVRGKMEVPFRMLISDDSATVSDSVGSIFSAVEQAMLTAAECQPDELRQRVEGTEELLREWATGYATELVLKRKVAA